MAHILNRSEMALKGIPRESYFIGSKVGRYEKNVQRMFDFSAEKTEAAVDMTLERLGLDLNPEIIEETDIKISTVLSYAKSTLHDNRLQNFTNYFKSKGVGVINAAATGMGLLTNNGPQPWHPASDHIKSFCKQASDYCKEQGVELARLATWFTLNQPNIDTNVCGFFDIAQMKDTLSLVDGGLTQHEQNILADLQSRFFDKVCLHWDGVELPAYREELKNKNK
ncbi:uncharacterized protein [Choristoneura fumiferana]|uniref:uncharacterized protein n=1 Tax=Choristoneura fumiferana TaxID=7141 RepID=UPI003D1535FC